jgi:hypothetical protein
MLVRQALYHLSQIPIPFLALAIFLVGSPVFAQIQLQIATLLISAF